MAPNPVVYVVDPDATQRRQTESQLEGLPIDFVGLEGAAELFTSLESRRVGCILSELQLRGCTALQLMRELRDMNANLPMVIVTSKATVPIAVQVFRAGAFDLLEKPTSPFQLSDVVHQAFELHAHSLASTQCLREFQQRLAKLTSVEREVMQLMLDGIPNKCIAAKLKLSARTIVFRRKSLLAKMQASSIAELAVIAQYLAGTAKASPSVGSLDLEHCGIEFDLERRRRSMRHATADRRAGWTVSAL